MADPLGHFKIKIFPNIHIFNLSLYILITIMIGFRFTDFKDNLKFLKLKMAIVLG